MGFPEYHNNHFNINRHTSLVILHHCSAIGKLHLLITNFCHRAQNASVRDHIFSGASIHYYRIRFLAYLNIMIWSAQFFWPLGFHRGESFFIYTGPYSIGAQKLISCVTLHWNVTQPSAFERSYLKFLALAPSAKLLCF